MKMSDNAKFVTWSVSSILTFLLLALFVVVAAKSFTCSRRWADSGLQTDFKVFGGCRVSKDGVHWIPESSYREIAD